MMFSDGLFYCAVCIVLACMCKVRADELFDAGEYYAGMRMTYNILYLFMLGLFVSAV